MGEHTCPTCKTVFHCIDPDCEDDGSIRKCRMCFDKEHDVNPDTRMSYPGAFADWKRTQDNMACGICGQIHEGECDFKFLKEHNLTWLSNEQIKELGFSTKKD